MVIHDNEFETKENKIWTKDKIEPQQVFFSVFCITSLWWLHLSTTPTVEVKSVGTFPVILVRLATPPLPP